MKQKLVRFVWSLYPARFRRRFGRELRRDLQLPCSPAGTSAAWQLLDALLILPRLWWLELTRSSTGVSFGTDVRLGLRVLRRSPGYAFVVIAILAMAIGGNTAVFSVTHAVLLKGLPYESPERVVSVWAMQSTTERGWVVDPWFVELPHVEAAALYVDGGGANLTRDGGSRRATLAQVTDHFFWVIGVTPLIGTGQMVRDSNDVVLSHSFWTQSFASDRNVIGSEIELNDRTYRVAGVMPAGVAFPSPVDLWLPFPTDSEFYSSAFAPSGLALLSPDSDPVALQRVLEDRLRAAYADSEREPPPVRINGLRDELTGAVRTPILVLLATAAMLVLLGCFNLAGLVLSRTEVRARELSVRRALGASRLLLFRQVFVEVLALAALGGIASVAAATAATGLLRRMLPAETPGLDGAGLTVPVLVFAGGLTLVAALLVGLMPALQGAFARTRHDSGRSSTEDRRSRRVQAALVIAQVALAFVLVVGAVLLGRTLLNLQSVPLGYDLDQVLTFQVRLPGRYDGVESRGPYIRDFEASLTALPGVADAGVTTYLPQQPAMGIGLRLRPPDVSEETAVSVTWVQADAAYFQAMGIPIVQGNPFADLGADERGFDRLVISESLAAMIFPDEESAVGRRVLLGTFDGWVDARIEAVVGDVYLRDRRARPEEIVYTWMGAMPSPALGFAVRASGDAAGLAPRVREIAAELDRGVAVFNLATTGQTAAHRIAVETAVARLAMVFSISALVLAGLGLYGLVSQALVRRRRELGIRLALGAHPRGLVREAMAGPLRLTAVGLVAGAVGAVAASRWISSLLFGVSPSDPRLVAAVIAVVVAVASIAAWLSARGALRVDPVESLRAE